eukprot:1833266-Pleurochrysis_carterae.AAC.1
MVQLGTHQGHTQLSECRCPTVSHFRPTFCLAYARRPDALQGRKLKPSADKCIHLGTSPNKPGYRLE